MIYNIEYSTKVGYLYINAQRWTLITNNMSHFVSNVILQNVLRYSLKNDDNAQEWSIGHSSEKSRNALSF